MSLLNKFRDQREAMIKKSLGKISEEEYFEKSGQGRWITTDDGNRAFLGGDGKLRYTKDEIESHKKEEGKESKQKKGKVDQIDKEAFPGYNPPINLQSFDDKKLTDAGFKKKDEHFYGKGDKRIPGTITYSNGKTEIKVAEGKSGMDVSVKDDESEKTDRQKLDKFNLGGSGNIDYDTRLSKEAFEKKIADITSKSSSKNESKDKSKHASKAKEHDDWMKKEAVKNKAVSDYIKEHNKDGNMVIFGVHASDISKLIHETGKTNSWDNDHFDKVESAFNKVYDSIKDKKEPKPKSDKNPKKEKLSPKAQGLLDSGLNDYQKASPKRKEEMINILRENLDRDKHGLKHIGMGLDEEHIKAAKAFLQQIGKPYSE